MGIQTFHLLLLGAAYCISSALLFGTFISKSKSPPRSPQSAPSQETANPTTGSTPRSINFIETGSLSDGDMYSGAWWQSTLRFLTKHNVSNFFVEEGAFWTAYRRREHEVRMTVDFLDFSVEHMSKWWKIAEIDRPGNEQAYHVITDALLSFVARSAPSSTTNVTEQQRTAMHDTLALVVFSPWKTKVSRTWTNTLSACSLTATMASLIRVGCGRIIVATDASFFRSTIEIVEGVSRLLKDEIQRDRLELEKVFSQLKRPKRKWDFQVGNTEITLQWVNCTADEGAILRKRPIIAKSALLSLKRVLLAQDKQNLMASKWLGTNDKQWKFLYLTEADTILRTNTDALISILPELETGNIVIPHRLQPMPHESDLPNFNWRHKVIPAIGDFANVASVGSNSHCCDGGAFYPHKNSPQCNKKTFWYSCGFPPVENKHQTGHKLAENHFRLAHYGLMRLKEGTGMSCFVGNQNGRRCTLQKRPCGS